MPTTEEDTVAPTGCVLSLWSINGTLVNRIKIESEVTCLTYTTAPEGVYVNVIATGMRDGNVRYVCVCVCVCVCLIYEKTYMHASTNACTHHTNQCS